jgi:hypothetical protein
MKRHAVINVLLLLFIILISEANAAGQVIVCIQCHASQSAKLSQPVKLWQTSIHAEHGIACNACHGGDPLDSAKAMSPAKGFRRVPIPTAIPALCGSCHMGVAKHYTNSAHGRTLGRGGPTCVTCHGSHDIKSATLDLIGPKHCSKCHTFEKARLIRSAMLKRDNMLMAIEKKIRVLKSQGIETDNIEKRLFALRNRFHAMFHSLDIKLIIKESEHIQAEIEKTNGVGGKDTGPLAGAMAVGWALLLALLFYLIKRKVD